MSLTDDLKAGKAEEGYYYVRIQDNSIMVMWLTKKSDINGWEILGKCPDYEELQKLKEENKDLQEGADALRELNKFTRRNYDEKVDKLRNLLKESCNELKILRTLSLPLASQEALNECDVLLTRLHAAIGESEE